MSFMIGIFVGVCIGYVLGMAFTIGAQEDSTWIPGAPGRNAKQGTQDVREPL